MLFDRNIYLYVYNITLFTVQFRISTKDKLYVCVYVYINVVNILPSFTSREVKPGKFQP